MRISDWSSDVCSSDLKIHVIAPDIGGGFGNKVGVYPGYVCAIVGSIVLGVPVKWVEDRMENLSATAFARDYHMTAELAATRDGRITGLRAHVLADHRSEEHTSELQSLMRISYAVFCLKKKKNTKTIIQQSIKK